MARSRVDWFGGKVLAHFEDVTALGLEALAARIDGQAKVNINQNGQIDTGFMINTVYFVGPSGSTYDATARPGSYKGDKAKAPEAGLEDAEAIVAVGADYAIFQELADSFLYKALVQVAGEAGGIIEEVARKHD